MFGVLQNEVLENSVKSLTDELQDVRAERDVFQQKAHRLNVEMNHIVGNDEIRILDIDALCMENRSASLIEDLWFSQLIQRRSKTFKLLCRRIDSLLSCRYLHQQFNRLQEEITLLKTNLVKYKVCILCILCFPTLTTMQFKP